MKFVNYGVLGSTSGFPQISLNDIHTVQQGVFECNKAFYKKSGGDGTNPVIIGVTVTDGITTFDSTGGYIITPEGYSIPIASNTGAAKVGSGQYYIKVNTPTGYGPPTPQAGGGAIQRHFQISAVIEHNYFTTAPAGYYAVTDCGGQSIMIYNLPINAPFGYSGAGYSRYQRSADGTVTLELHSIEQVSLGSTIGNLPVGYYPKEAINWTVIADNAAASCRLFLGVAGNIIVSSLPVGRVFTTIISYPTL